MKRIGDVIASVFDGETMEKAEGYSAFFSCWKDLIEKNRITPAMAAHSWIKSVDNGLVWIEVDHPGCKQILQTYERKLLHDFRYRFPHLGISGISIMLCRPGTGPEGVKNEPGTEKPTVEGEEQSTGYVETPIPAGADEREPDPGYDGIKNKTLRELLMRLEKSIADKNR